MTDDIVNEATRLITDANKAPSGPDIVAMCFEMASFLLVKNIAYGDSAMEPFEVFHTGTTPAQAILIRINDKLKRIKNGGAYPGDDDIKDLIGYLILYRIMENKDAESVGSGSLQS